MREAAKELGPGLTDREITRWMAANGFGQVSNVLTLPLLRVECFTELSCNPWTYYNPRMGGHEHPVRRTYHNYTSSRLDVDSRQRLTFSDEIESRPGIKRPWRIVEL